MTDFKVGLCDTISVLATTLCQYRVCNISSGAQPESRWQNALLTQLNCITYNQVCICLYQNRLSSWLLLEIRHKGYAQRKLNTYVNNMPIDVDSSTLAPLQVSEFTLDAYLSSCCNGFVNNKIIPFNYIDCFQGQACMKM